MLVKAPTSLKCRSLFLMRRRASQVHPIWRAHGVQTSSHIIGCSLIFVSKRRRAMDSYPPASTRDWSQEPHGYQNPKMLKSCYIKWMLHLWIQRDHCASLSNKNFRTRPLLLPPPLAITCHHGNADITGARDPPSPTPAFLQKSQGEGEILRMLRYQHP